MRWALLLVALIAACGGSSSGESTTTTGPCTGLRGAECDVALGRTPVCEKAVVYFVEGSASSISITIQNAGGNTEQASDLAVPLSTDDGEGLRIGRVPCGEFVYISAQNQGESGTVTCRIEADGVEIEEATSEGAFVIASCSGSVPFD